MHGYKDVVCPRVAVCVSADTLGGQKCQVPGAAAIYCCELHNVGAEIRLKSSGEAASIFPAPPTVCF